MFPVIMYVLLLKKTIRKNQLNVQQGIKILNVPYLVYSSRAGLANVETPAVSELTISYRKCYSYYCSSSQLGALLKTVITIKFCPFLDKLIQLGLHSFMPLNEKEDMKMHLRPFSLTLAKP